MLRFLAVASLALNPDFYFWDTFYSFFRFPEILQATNSSILDMRFRKAKKQYLILINLILMSFEGRNQRVSLMKKTKPSGTHPGVWFFFIKQPEPGPPLGNPLLLFVVLLFHLRQVQNHRTKGQMGPF